MSSILEKYRFFLEIAKNGQKLIKFRNQLIISWLTISEKKTLFFQDTRDNQEHDAKNRLSLFSPSLEKPVAEIDQLKENRP